MLVSLTLSWSSESWFVTWVCMEMISFFFIPLISEEGNSGVVVSGWKYLIVQSLGSFMYLISILQVLGSGVGGVVITAGLWVKLGIPPFHGWVVHLVEVMSWGNIYVIITLQKCVPLVAYINQVSVGSSIPILLSMGYVLVCLVGCFSSKMMLSLSSIYTSGWMLMSCQAGEAEFTFFFVLYMYQVGVVFLSIVGGNLSSVMLNETSLGSMTTKVVGILLLIGLPPFGMFIGKIEVVCSLISQSSVTGGLLLVITSITVVLYLKLVSVSILYEASEKVGVQGFIPLVLLSAIPWSFWFIFS